MVAHDLNECTRPPPSAACPKDVAGGIVQKTTTPGRIDGDGRVAAGDEQRFLTARALLPQPAYQALQCRSLRS